jgi:hypothetical protein
MNNLVNRARHLFPPRIWAAPDGVGDLFPALPLAAQVHESTFFSAEALAN